MDNTRVTYLSLGLIALCISAVYGQTFYFDLITFDDNHFITKNDNVLKGITLDTVKWAITTDKTGIWHPLTWLTYQAESSLLGADNNAVRHVTNAALHFFNAALIYLVCLQVKQSNRIALMAALIFALHPQHVQVVAWISERKELLATFFALSSLVIFLKWRIDGRCKYYVLVVLLYALALMSKPSALPMVALFIVIDTLYFNNIDRSNIYKRVGEYLPLILLASAVAMITISIKTHDRVSMVFSDGQATMTAFRWLSLIPLNLAHYLQSSLWPWPLPVLIETPRTVEPGRLFIAVGIIITALLIWWTYKRKGSVFNISVLWFILFWLPISGLISMGSYYVADRYMYQPHIGLIIGITILADSTLKYRQSIKTVFGVAALLALGILTSIQVGYWKDSVTLFDRELVINPASERAPIYAGWQKQLEGEVDHALLYYGLAITNNPKSYYGYAYKGFLKFRIGHHREAVELFKKALTTPNSKRGHYVNVVYEKLAWLLFVQGKYQEAEKIINRAKKRNIKSKYILTIERNIRKRKEKNND